MTLFEQTATIAMCVLGTVTTRFLPFLLFSEGRPTPKFVRYLGKALPAAIFGMLVVYCLKNVNLLAGRHGLPEFIGIAVTVALHLWRRQMLLSIAGGTFCYMLLVQLALWIMPELPEVETVRRVLEPQITGRRIGKIDVRNAQVIARPDVQEFCAALTGQTIVGMGRRGKFLRIDFESGDAVILHLRMTGSLLLTPRGWPEEKHTHLVFALGDGSELRYLDQRRFGRFWLLRAGETDDFTGAQKLGLEPFDKSLTAKYLQNAFAKSKRPIKDCLLDQSVVAGIGNIYSDEILFVAKIRPDRQAAGLTCAEWARLAKLIPERLSYFLEKNVISAEDYLAGRGDDYRNTPFLQVYGRAGELCPVCGETLCKTTVAGRGSVFCPSCQRQQMDKNRQQR